MEAEKATQGTTLLHLDSDTFDEKVYDEAEPIAVLFTRKTCAICRRMRPVLERLAASGAATPGGQNWTFAEVDAEESFDLMQRFGLAGVPQLLLFVDGEPRGQVAGAVTDKQVRGLLQDA